MDVLIEMYKADRQPGTLDADAAAEPCFTTLSSSSSKLLRRPPPLSLRRDPDAVSQHCDTAKSPTPSLQPTVTQSLRRARPSRPMLRNLSDLGPRVTCRSTALWPPVSVLVTSTVSPTVESTTSVVDVDQIPTASSPSSGRRPFTICESNDEVGRQQFPQTHQDNDNDDSDVIRQLLLPVDDDTRPNHIAPQHFADHVTVSSNAIGRTNSPSDNNSQTVIAL